VSRFTLDFAKMLALGGQVHGADRADYAERRFSVPMAPWLKWRLRTLDLILPNFSKRLHEPLIDLPLFREDNETSCR
jgi:hypothetical protein